MLCFQRDLTAIKQSKTSTAIRRVLEEIPSGLAVTLALEMSKATVVCFLKTLRALALSQKKDPPQAAILTLLCIWGSGFWIMLFPYNSWWGFLLHGYLKLSWDCTHSRFQMVCIVVNSVFLSTHPRQSPVLTHKYHPVASPAKSQPETPTGEPDALCNLTICGLPPSSQSLKAGVSHHLPSACAICAWVCSFKSCHQMHTISPMN